MRVHKRTAEKFFGGCGARLTPAPAAPASRFASSESYTPKHLVEHEAWVPEDTEVVNIFARPREDFLAGGTPAYMRKG